jgi:hypothetical protein
VDHHRDGGGGGGSAGTIGFFIVSVVHDEMKRLFVFQNCVWEQF